MIPHSRPQITDGDVAAVSDVLRSRFIGRYSCINALEAKIAQSVGMQEAICLGSGRAAIMFALEVFRGRTVYLPTYSTIDLLNAAHWAGCNIKLYDLGETGEDLMLVVHGPLASEVPRGTYAIYDFANVFPDNFDLRNHTAVFSFGPLKPITGGHGGAISCRSILDRNKIENISPMTDINAALVLSQLKRPAPEKRLLQVDDFEACERDFLAQGIIVRHETGWLLHRLLGAPDSNFPKAVKRWNTTVSVPNYSDLTEEERERIDHACRRYSV